MSNRIALAIVIGILNGPAAWSQSHLAASSVRDCGDSGADRKTESSSPGRLRLGCWNVRDLILAAYVRYDNGQDHSLLSTGSALIEGGPALECNRGMELGQRFAGMGCWIDSDRFTIDAKAKGAPKADVMSGPVLQSLLEDKFKLRLHREIREVPVYELVVSNGGFRLQASEEKTPSNRFETSIRGMVTVEAQATSLDEFCKLLSVFPAGLGRPVIDRTGIPGLFDFHLNYARSSIFAALDQLGLKLEPATGPREVLVVDHVERPSTL